MKLEEEPREIFADILGLSASIILSIMALFLFISAVEPYMAGLYEHTSGGSLKIEFMLGIIFIFLAFLIPMLITFAIFRLLEKGKLVAVANHNIFRSVLNFCLALFVVQVILFVLGNSVLGFFGGSVVWFGFSLFSIADMISITRGGGFDSLFYFMPTLGLIAGVLLSYHYQYHNRLDFRNNESMAAKLILLPAITGLAIVGAWNYAELSTKVYLASEEGQQRAIVQDSVSNPDPALLGFRKISVHWMDMYYPKSWGNGQKTSFKAYSPDYERGQTRGEREIFRSGQKKRMIEVNDEETFMNRLATQDTMLYLKKAWDERAIKPETVLSLAQAGYIASDEINITAHSPQYIESNNGNWRGYWYLGSLKSSKNGSIKFIAVLYNKGEKKVTTINADMDYEGAKPTKPLEAWDKIISEIDSKMLKTVDLIQ